MRAIDLCVPVFLPHVLYYSGNTSRTKFSIFVNGRDIRILSVFVITRLSNAINSLKNKTSINPIASPVSRAAQVIINTRACAVVVNEGIRITIVPFIMDEAFIRDIREQLLNLTEILALG